MAGGDRAALEDEIGRSLEAGEVREAVARFALLETTGTSWAS